MQRKLQDVESLPAGAQAPLFENVDNEARVLPASLTRTTEAGS
jgi:hypothetical protein